MSLYDDVMGVCDATPNCETLEEAAVVKLVIWLLTSSDRDE